MKSFAAKKVPKFFLRLKVFSSENSRTSAVEIGLCCGVPCFRSRRGTMSDFLKSAMNYFNAGPTVGQDNEFVGQIVEISNVKLRIKRVIAEGGCSSVLFRGGGAGK